MDHLTDQQLRRATRSGDDAEAIALHLAGCPQCRARAWDVAEVGARIEALRAELAEQDLEAAGGDHLSYETIESWVEGSLGPIDLEIAEAHVADCAVCRRELDDLRDFVTRREPEQPRRPGRRLGALLALAAAALLGIGTGLVLRQRAAGPAGDAGPTAVARPPAQQASLPPAVSRPMALVRDANGLITRLPSGDVTGLPAEQAAMVADVAAGEQLRPPAILAQLAAGEEQLRGEGDDGITPRVELRSPVGVVVADAVPRFVWRGPIGDRYGVEVFSVELAPVRSARVHGTRWTPDAALPPGTYLWQVRALDAPGEPSYPQPPAPPARFHVLGEPARAEIERARATRSHLALAVALARHGVVEEAESELRALAARDPQAELPGRLLAELGTWPRPLTRR